MLQNHAWVKDPHKVQERPVDFNRSECEKFTNMVSDSTLQLTFMKLPSIDIWSSIKEEYAQLPEEIIKILYV